MSSEQTPFQVIVAAEAETMLIEHARFLAQVNLDAADRLVADFLTLVETLEQMPQRFPFFIYQGYQQEKYRKALFAGRYLAIFCVDTPYVYLDFVLDCRKNYQELLEGFGQSPVQ